MSWLWNALTSPLRSFKKEGVTPGCSPTWEPLEVDDKAEKFKTALKLSVKEVDKVVITKVLSETDEEGNWNHEDYLGQVNKPKQYRVIQRKLRQQQREVE